MYTFWVSDVSAVVVLTLYMYLSSVFAIIVRHSKKNELKY